MSVPCKVLVLCSRNRWRSPTAEKLINALPGYRARSAGTAASARVRVNQKHVEWADVILVMEPHHAKRVREEFGPLLQDTPLHCLDVPDDHQFMDPELVQLLHERLPEFLPAIDPQARG